MLLLSYRNTRESLGELGKAVETLTCGLCSHSISCSPKLPLVSITQQKHRTSSLLILLQYILMLTTKSLPMS